MKKFEYKEPEFKVVSTNAQDVLTASLDIVSDAWDTGSNNHGGGIAFGI